MMPEKQNIKMKKVKNNPTHLWYFFQKCLMIFYNANYFKFVEPSGWYAYLNVTKPDLPSSL